MTSLIVAILLLGVLVFVHEFGHFVVAKISGMRVEIFSIGMGPSVATYKKGETEYVFGAIPAGGYVSVTGATTGADDDSDLDEDDPRRYPNKPIIQRALFAAAGPFMNFLLAIVILMIIFMSVGVDVPKADLDTTVSTIAEKSPAEKAGLLPGDRIKKVDGVSVTTWGELNKAVSARKGAKMHLTILRDGHEVVLPIQAEWNEQQKSYLLGVTREMEFEHRKLGVSEAAQTSLTATKRMSTLILDAVGNLITGKASVTDKEEGLTGPVGIVKVIDQTTSQGIWNVLMLMAILSINLGLLNLLPIPALDGSRLLFLLLEAVRGKPVSAEREGIVNFVGFACLMFLMIYVTYHDIARLL